MSNTKICPACQKELPILAVRCKFCGIKQPVDRDDEYEGAGKQMTKPLNAVKNRSTTASGPSVATTLPPKAIAQKGPSPEKRKTMMGVGMGAGTTGSSAVKKKKSTVALGSASGSPFEDRKTSGDESAKSARLSSAAAGGNRKKTVLGVSASPAANKSQVLKPPKPSAAPAHAAQSKPLRPSAMKTRPAKLDIQKPKRPLGAARVSKRNLGLNDIDTTDASWIPDVDDNSQLIHLDADAIDVTGPVFDSATETHELDFDDLSEVVRADAPGNESETRVSAVAHSAKAKDWAMVRLARIRVWVLRIDWSRLRARFQQLPEFARKGAARLSAFVAQQRERTEGIRRIHLIVAVLGALMVVGIVLLVAMAGGEPGMDSNTKESTPPVKAVSKTDRSTPTATAKDVQKKQSAPVSTPDSVNAAVPEATEDKDLPPVVVSDRPCQPMEKYGAISLDNVLKAAMTYVRGVSVCDLMGRNMEVVAAAFDSEQIRFSGGYDGLTDGTVLEVAPVQNDIGDGLVRFLFYQDKLFRIVFEFGMSKDMTVDMKQFEKRWGKRAGVYRLKEQTIVAIDDGEVRVELVTDRIGPPNRRGVISDLKVGRELALKLDANWRAVQRTAMGDVLLKKERYRKAAQKYRDALKESAALGAAYLGLAEARLGMDDAAGARKTLASGADSVTDERMADAIKKRLAAMNTD